MTRRGMILCLAVALAGYGALALLFPAYDNSARWGFSLDRSSAEKAARDAARQWGVETTGWQVRMRPTVSDDEEYYAWRGNVPGIDRHSSVDLLVLVTHPSKPESVRVRLDAAGTPVRVALRTSTPAAAGVDARALAGRALQKFGVPVDSYQLSAEETRADGSSRFRWTKAAPGAPELTLFAEADVLKGSVKRVARGTVIADDFRKSFTPASRAFSVTQISVIIGWFLAAVVMLVRSAVQRRLPARSFVRFGVLSFGVLLILLATQPTFGERDFEGMEDRNGSRVVGVMDLHDPETYLILLEAFVVAMSWAIVWGGGAAAMRAAFPFSAAAFEDLLRGRLSRSQGTAILTGMCFGGLVAAARYLLAASGLFQRTFLSTDPRGLTSPDLLFVYDSQLSVIGILFGFAFVLPVLATLVRSRAVILVLTAVFFTVWSIEGDFTRSFVLEITSKLLVAVILILIFRWQGLLGVLSAAVAANVAMKIAMLMTQPSRSAVYGVLLLVALLAAFAGTFYLARRGPERATVLSELGSARTQRERIQEELDLAREAQQKMLPASSPAVNGFEIEAICRPARQVGGDLYDYRILRDGRLCIAVADVCGKGVTAALYMTIVKGLFVAATDTEVDPVEIAADINAGLHALRHRNVFVTMFVGVLDPDARRLRFIRAGHNPALWIRGATREVVPLTPAGMALGMTNPTLFRRSLRAEEVTLEPEDVLIVHSDGVTEAMNGARDEYGDERFRRSAAVASRSGAAEARDAIVRDVSDFVGSAPAHDDLTLVVIRAVA